MNKREDYCTIKFSVPVAVYDKLVRMACESGCSLSRFIANSVRNIIVEDGVPGIRSNVLSATDRHELRLLVMGRIEHCDGVAKRFEDVDDYLCEQYSEQRDCYISLLKKLE